MQKYGDLHIHTIYSDGTERPDEIFLKAKTEGINCISITDHDTLRAYEEYDFEELSQKYEIEFITGIELSADFADENNHIKDVHILGYGINPFCKAIISYCNEYQNMRKERAKKMLKKLNQMNINISWEELENSISHQIYGRLHIAKLLVKKNYVSSIKEAFDNLIGYDSPAYVKKEQKDVRGICELIYSCKGIPVIAHPGLQNLEKNIKKLKEYGIKGIEVFHPDHDENMKNLLLNLCKKHNMLVFGGSDYHGSSKENIHIGTIKLPYEYIEKFKERINV